MTIHAISQLGTRRKTAGVLMLSIASAVVLLGIAGSLVAYLLWPTWPIPPSALDAPPVPVTIAGVLFNVPMAAIRPAVQRHPGAHDRIDLVFLWPSLEPPPPPGTRAPASGSEAPAHRGVLALPNGKDRLFVTVSGLGAVLAPGERLRTIYPRYIEQQAAAGHDGLAIVGFRSDTPYEGEDLVYVEEKPEQFFARCTRAARGLPGTCIHERVVEGAEIGFRFPRQWLADWRSLAAGFDRLMVQLHPGPDKAAATTAR